MNRLSFRLSKSKPSGYRHCDTAPSHYETHPNVEELEQRNLPAPIITGSGALSGLIPPRVETFNATQSLQATTFTAAQATTFSSLASMAFSAVPAGTGTIFAQGSDSGVNQVSPFPTTASPSLSFQTSSIPPSVIVGALPFVGLPSLVPTGLPDPTRTGPPIPLTIGTDAPLPGKDSYVVKDMALSGGGGESNGDVGPSTEYRPPVQEDQSDDNQTKTESSIIGPTEFDMMSTSAVLREAIFQLTV